MEQLTQLELIKIVAGSSFFGAIFGSGITALVNWLLSKRNFKFKSYEEIVKRRFSAYEKMATVGRFLNFYVRELDDKIIPYAFANGLEELERFQMLVMEVYPESFWLDEEIGDLFTELNVYLHNVNAEAVVASDPEATIKEIAVRDKATIKSISKRLSKQLREDLINIHQVRKFVNRTTKPKPRFPVKSWSDPQE